MEALSCLLWALFMLGLGLGGIWAAYALVRAHRFVGRAEERLARLEARLGIGSPASTAARTGVRPVPGAPQEAATPAPASTGSPAVRPAAEAAAWSATTTARPDGAMADDAGVGEGTAAPADPARPPAGSPEAPRSSPGPGAGSANGVSGPSAPGTPSDAEVPAAAASGASSPAEDGPPSASAGAPSGAPPASPASPAAPSVSGPSSPSPPGAPSSPDPRSATGSVAGTGAPPPSPPPSAASPSAGGWAGADAPPPPASAGPPASSEVWWHDLEERLGAKLPVWLGAIALALAGAFLVKYSVDQGWLGPPVRVGLGIGFGVALLAGSGVLRRSARPIAGALAAAGVAVLYAAFLAASNLYGLVTPVGGFALMTLTTAVAVGLSLVFGPIVAVVGLVGGLLTPYWIQVGEPDPKRLFAYLLLVHGGVVAVSTRRSWPGLSLASLAGGFVWVLAWLAGAFRPGDGVWLQLFLLVALVAWGATAPALRRPPEDAGEEREGWGTPRQLVVVAAALGTLAVFGVVTEAEGFGALQWSLVGLLLAGLLVVARLRPEHHLLAWLGSATSAVLLLRWALALDRVAGTVSDAPGRFLLVTTLLGVLVAAGAWLALWRLGLAGAPRHPARWGTLCAAAAVVHPVLAWLGWRSAYPEPSAEFPWTGVAVAVAALLAAAALPVARHRERPGMEAALAALAVAVTAMLSWAAALGFEREVLTVAWALEVAALAWLAGWFRMPVLVRLAAILAVPVVARISLNPLLLEAAAGEPRIFNVVLWVHAAAILSFAAAVALLDRQAGSVGTGRPGDGGAGGAGTKAADRMGAGPSAGAGPAGEGGSGGIPAGVGGGAEGEESGGGAGVPGSGTGRTGTSAAAGAQGVREWLGASRWSPLAARVAAGMRWAVLLLLLTLVSMEVAHGFHPDAPLERAGSGPAAALEVATLVVSWLGLGLFLLAAARRWPERVGAAGRYGSRGVVVLGLAAAILGPCLLTNPTFVSWEVGATPVFNHLLWVYGLPVLLLGLGVRLLAPGTPRQPAADRVLRPAWASGALLLLFVLVTLEVLQVFRGEDLTRRTTDPSAEGWALSAAWLLLGMALLGAGIASRRRFLRAAALAVTALAVVKVFLFDVARLGDLYRVLSFLGLGLSLLLLAWLYQRFVFRRGPASGGGGGEGSEGPPGDAGEPAP